MNERNAITQSLAAKFAELLSYSSRDEEDIRRQNAGGGFSIDIHLGNEGPGSYSRVDHIRLSEDELNTALADARMIIENPEAAAALRGGATISEARTAEPWFDQLRALHGGDQRRIGSSGMTIDELAAAIPSSRRSVIKWLHGEADPNLAARAAIERLYESQRRPK